MGDNKTNKTYPPQLGQYFNQDNGGNNIFDQISNLHSSAMMKSVVESASTQDLFKTANDYMSSDVASGVSSMSLNVKESPNEPVVCKIFAQEEVKPSEKTASFFDLISSSKQETKKMLLATGNPKKANAETNSLFEDLKIEGPYPSPLQGFEDLSDVLHSSESDRTRDAWIPSMKTRQLLIQAATSAPGTFNPEKENLTMPGVVLEEDMADMVTQLVKHHFGEAEANHRKVLTVADVSQDERGIRELIQAECFRAAVNLTGRLLSLYGQGAGRQGHQTKHTVHSIQLWFTRLSLLVKLGAYQIADEEGSIWWDLDRPDLYYQFYPELYGGKPGTMVPFQMRLLIATLPAYLKKCPQALERLYSILAVVRQILKNLCSGKSEDGSLLELGGKEREIAKRVWLSREARVMHSIVNVALMSKDYILAIETLQSLISKNSSVNQKRALQSALGRVFLQLGDVINAEKCFTVSRQLKRNQTGTLNTNKADLRELVDRGLTAVAQNSFSDAYEYFQKASLLDPTNIMVLNNMAVCLLYMGQLKNALTLLTSAIQTNPSLALSEALLLNVCTLFELESSRCDKNKQALLRQVAKYKGDAINVSCLKLHM